VRDKSATGVLLSWKRERNIPQIVAGMMALPCVAQVVLWDNAETDLGVVMEKWEPLRKLYGYTMGPEQGRLHVTCRDRNLCCYARYKAAQIFVNTESVLTCDDDYLPDWQPILEAAAGESFVHALEPGHYRQQQSSDRKPWSLVGWGAVFDRSLIRLLGAYIARWGEDRVLLREADRIFTMLAEIPRTLLASGQRFQDATGPMALYRQPEHEAYINVARARAELLLGRISEQKLAQIEDRNPLVGK
jgi:hypothetical protein